MSYFAFDMSELSILFKSKCRQKVFQKFLKNQHKKTSIVFSIKNDIQTRIFCYKIFSILITVISCYGVFV